MILKSLCWFMQHRGQLGLAWVLFGRWVPAGSQESANEQFKSHRLKEAKPDSLLLIQVNPSEKRGVDEIVMQLVWELSPSQPLALKRTERIASVVICLLFFFFKAALQRWYLVMRSKLSVCFHWKTASCWIHNVCFGDKLGSQVGTRPQSMSLKDCSASQNVNYGKQNKEANQLNSEWIFLKLFNLAQKNPARFLSQPKNPEPFLSQPNKDTPLLYSQACWNIIVLLMRRRLNLIVFWRRPLGLPQMNSLSLVGCWLKLMQSISGATQHFPVCL